MMSIMNFKKGTVMGSESGKVALTVVAFLAVGFLGMLVFNFPTASNQGYVPDQPIPFSHKIHAGQNKMDCQYCHVGPERSQHSVVPSLNVCMNCHSVVKTDSPHIQTLKKHFQEGKPVEWLRVHELPDHVRFTHSRHVQKGVKCETCHGNVAEMEKLTQFAPLTMGWCLDCHRGRATPSYLQRALNPENPTGNLPVAPENCSTCHY